MGATIRIMGPFINAIGTSTSHDERGDERGAQGHIA
jgi:hypothetical protein